MRSAPPLAASPTSVPKKSPATAAANPSRLSRALGGVRRQRIIGGERGIDAMNQGEKLLVSWLRTIEARRARELIGEADYGSVEHISPVSRESLLLLRDGLNKGSACCVFLGIIGQLILSLRHSFGPVD